MKAAKFRSIAVIAALVLLLAFAALGYFTPGGRQLFGRGRNNGEMIAFEGKTYILTFSDDFDILDSSSWEYCPEEKRQDAGGEWRNACTAVEDGNLVITCSIAEDGTPVSGGIRSVREHEQTFGLYHMRFKMEKADGLWYAFWLMTDKMFDATEENGATDAAELDIIEVVPHNGQLYMSVHWDGYGANRKSCSESLSVSDDFYDDYHELWYVWDRNGYRLYLDGTDESCLLFDFPGEECGDGTCAVPCDMILSAEYGYWGGSLDSSQLPVHYYVDYVRVYSEADTGR